MADRMGSLSLGVRVIGRELRSQPSVVVAIAVGTLIAAGLLASAPRQLEDVATEDLLATVSAPGPVQRNIRVELLGRVNAGPDGDPMRPIRESGEVFADTEFPPSVRGIVSSQYYVVDTPRFAVTPMPGEPPFPFERFLTFRLQEHIDEHVEIVDGEFARPQAAIPMLVGVDCPLDPAERAALEGSFSSGEIEANDEFDCRLEELPHYAVVVSPQTAEDMGVTVGSQVLVTPDATDRLFSGISTEALDYQMVVTISGIIELSAIEEEYWYADSSLHRPSIRENADFRVIYATGLMSEHDYESLLTTTRRAGRANTWRHVVDPDLVAETDVHNLLSELEPFLLRFTPVLARPDDFRVITQLSDLLYVHLDQRSHTVALVSLAVAGVLTVVVAVIVLLAVLMTERQRRSITLERNRGATRGQLTTTRLYEGLIMVVPAATLGYIAAALAFAGTDHLFSYRAVAALVVASIAALISAGLRLHSRRLGSMQREVDIATRSSPGRLIAELLVVALGAGAFVLLRRRGEADDGIVGDDFDVLLAMAPTLLAVAAGVIAMRVYPLLIRGLSRIASKRRGVVGFVGLKRIVDQQGSQRLPVLVFVVCVAIAMNSSIVRESIMAGQEAGSWQVVGADYAVKGAGPDVRLPDSLDINALAPHSLSATGRTFADARIRQGARAVPAEVLAIDALAYQSMTEETAGDVDLPAFLWSEAGAEPGSPTNPIPVILSTDWPADIDASIGNVLTLDLGTVRPLVRVMETRDRYPDIPADTPFAVVGIDSLASFDNLALTPTVAYLRAPRSVAGELESTLEDEAPGARLISRYDALDSIAEDPFIRWAVTTLQVLFYVAVVFAVVTGVASLTIASNTRRRDFAYLRTLGLDSRQSTGMTAMEQLPPALVGTVIGALVGVATALGIGQVFEIDLFTGGAVPTDIVVDWSVISIVGAAVFGVLALAIIVFVMVNRRTEVVGTLRVGDE